MDYFKRQWLLNFFLLALVVSVALGTITPVFTQPAPVRAECEQLKVKIETKAKEDAQSDRWDFLNTNKKKLKIGDVFALYSQENSKVSPPCFSDSQLWEIYEDEYDLHNLSLIPVFIILFLGSVVGAAISNTFKKGVTQFLEAIGRWGYKKFSGTLLFENIALKKYRQALIDKYQKLNIPFRPNRPLEMERVYVPLKVAGTSESSLIEAEEAMQKYHRLIVKGSPGSGKSMLLKYLALSYAEGRIKNISKRLVPILLELNRLNDLNLTLEKLEQQLVNACERNNFPNAKRFITQSLKDGRLILLLDGLDEISSSIRPHIILLLKNLLDTYEKCRAIITCRTAVYNNEFLDITEQTLEIVDFSDEQIRRFLQAWKSQMPPDKSVEQLIKTLRDRPKIIALARNPLLLTIIAYLYTDTPFVLPHSRAEFYTKATDILLELRDLERNIANQYRGINKRRVLQHLACYAQDSANQQEQDRRSLSYEVVLEQVKQVLPSLNLESNQAYSIVDEIVKRSGLLLSIDGGQRYQFAHLTLQEYFVAAALTDRQEKLIQQWQDSPSDWREIVKLWCGLANNSTALIEAIYERDPLTAFECLADAQEIAQETAQKILDNFKEKLGEEENEAIISAFGLVAADLRPRGRELFEFLTEKLGNEENLAERKVAAKALSMTSLPEAVENLASYYDSEQPHFREVREALVRMGGLAIAKLEFLARKGSVEAMDDLVKIAIPEAAEALERLQDDPNLKGQAAWRLGALLEQLEASQSQHAHTSS